MNQIESKEVELWTGHTSQLVNMKLILGAIFGFWLVFPAVAAIKAAGELWFHEHVLTSDRLLERIGFFEREDHEMELYKIMDVGSKANFFQQLIGVGDVHIQSKDPGHENHVLRSVHNYRDVANLIRHAAEQAKQNYTGPERLIG
ncbi:MAG: PH domain-containing protein [Planctomycetota bacterium]